MNLSARFLIGMSLVAASKMLAGSGHDPDLNADGWKGVAQRDEIRPEFVFRQDGGPNRNGSFIIRADKREGLEKDALGAQVGEP